MQNEVTFQTLIFFQKINFVWVHQFNFRFNAASLQMDWIATEISKMHVQLSKLQLKQKDGYPDFSSNEKTAQIRNSTQFRSCNNTCMHASEKLFALSECG